jgi:GxxExxY protein
MTEEEIAKATLDAAFKVHSALGPGLLESIYESALSIELSRNGFQVERQKPISVSYDGTPLEIGFRADLIVNGLVLVELKSVEGILPVHKKTVNSYLRLIPLKLGLLINFNEAHLKDGIVRVVNGVEGKPFLQVDLRKGAERQTGQPPRY